MGSVEDDGRAFRGCSARRGELDCLAFRGCSANRGDWDCVTFKGDFDCKGRGVESMNHWNV